MANDAASWGRYSPVPVSIRTALLAVAALAAVGVAVARSVSAGSSSAFRSGAEHAEIYGASPTEAAATLGRLRPPSGFEQARCRRPTSGEQAMCFHQTRAVLLSEAAWAKLVDATSAKVQRSQVPPFRCFGPKQRRLARAGGHVQLCEAEALIGRERLLFSESSFDPGRPSTDHLTTKYQREALKAWGRGTELEAWVIGHFLRRE
jgi:hypothetical protein